MSQLYNKDFYVLDIGSVFFLMASYSSLFPFVLNRYLILIESPYHERLFNKCGIFLWTFGFDLLTGGYAYITYSFGGYIPLYAYTVQIYISNTPFLLLQLVVIVIIFLTSITIRQKAKEVSHVVNKRENELRRTIVRVLFVQTMTSTALVIYYFFYYLSTGYGWHCKSFFIYGIGVCLVDFQELMLTFDSLVILFVLAPYRVALFGFLRKVLCLSNPNAVTVIPVSSQQFS